VGRTVTVRTPAGLLVHPDLFDGERIVGLFSDR